MAESEIALRARIAELEARNEELRARLADLTAEERRHTDTFGRLQQENATLRRQRDALRERIAAVPPNRRRFGP